MGKITLTIDNGPHPEVTPQVLQVLAERSVPACFFVIGEQVVNSNGVGLLARIVQAGHAVGNHTWSHRIQFGENADERSVADEVQRAAELIAPYASTPPLFRPAGGGGRLDSSLFSMELIQFLCQERYTCALWNAVPRDWEDPTGWVARALEQVNAQDWSVVVVHDVIPGNAEQIAAFIDGARQHGHHFVPDIAPECLPIVAGEIIQDLSALTGPRRDTDR